MESKKQIVYLVDDDKMLCGYLKILFKSWGYEPFIYNSAKDFLEQVTLNDYGAIILDINMPGIDGLKLQKALIEKEIHMPVVFLTGYGDVAKCAKAMKQGAIDFLEKPILKNQLFAILEKMFSSESERIRSLKKKHDAHKSYRKLTPREKQIFLLLVAGNINKTISKNLDISIVTVKLHRKNIMQKLNMKSFTQLSHFAKKIQ